MFVTKRLLVEKKKFNLSGMYHMLSLRIMLTIIDVTREKRGISVKTSDSLTVKNAIFRS